MRWPLLASWWPLPTAWYSNQGEKKKKKKTKTFLFLPWYRKFCLHNEDFSFPFPKNKSKTWEPLSLGSFLLFCTIVFILWHCWEVTEVCSVFFFPFSIIAAAVAFSYSSSHPFAGSMDEEHLSYYSLGDNKSKNTSCLYL